MQKVPYREAREFQALFLHTQASELSIDGIKGKEIMDTVTVLCPIAESVNPLTFQSALSVVGYSSRNGVQIEFIGVTERTLVDTARNVLTREFLKTSSDWAFWMDADMVLPKDAITQLLKTAKEKDAKMVTGIYYQRGRKHWPVCWVRDPKMQNGTKVVHENEDEYNANEFLGVYAVPGPEAKLPFIANTAGFGCCLIHRNVFESLEDPWFQFLPGRCSEDFYFFVNAKKKGFTLWADPTLHLGHVGSPKIVYREDCYENLKKDNTGLEAIK